jgi:hypothetical protein
VGVIVSAPATASTLAKGHVHMCHGERLKYTQLVWTAVLFPAGGQCESEYWTSFFAGLYVKYSLRLKYIWLFRVQYKYLWATGCGPTVVKSKLDVLCWVVCEVQPAVEVYMGV